MPHETKTINRNLRNQDKSHTSFTGEDFGKYGLYKEGHHKSFGFFTSNLSAHADGVPKGNGHSLNNHLLYIYA